MTVTVSGATTALFMGSSYETISTTVGFAVVVALAILLLQREVTRILSPERDMRSGWAFDIALIPFLMTFLIVISMRLIELVV